MVDEVVKRAQARANAAAQASEALARQTQDRIAAAHRFVATVRSTIPLLISKFEAELTPSFVYVRETTRWERRRTGRYWVTEDTAVWVLGSDYRLVDMGDRRESYYFELTHSGLFVAEHNLIDDDEAAVETLWKFQAAETKLRSMCDSVGVSLPPRWSAPI
jgi:hypothetical protein